MHCLYAAARQVADLERVIADKALTDVTIKPPFMGRAVVWCGSTRSRDALELVLGAREPEAA